MAIITRRYQFVGPPAADLSQFVSPTATVAATFQGPIVDISIDNTVEGVVQTLDDFMTTQGFQPNLTALKPTTAIIPYAPLAPVAFGIVTFCAFGAVAPIEDLANWPAPRPGILQSFQIDVTENTLTASTEFIIRTATGIGAFGDTALLINVSPGATGPFNFVGSILLNVGDRVSLRVTTTGLVGAISFTGAVEFD